MLWRTWRNWWISFLTLHCGLSCTTVSHSQDPWSTANIVMFVVCSHCMMWNCSKYFSDQVEWSRRVFRRGALTRVLHCPPHYLPTEWIRSFFTHKYSSIIGKIGKIVFSHLEMLSRSWPASHLPAVQTAMVTWHSNNKMQQRRRSKHTNILHSGRKNINNILEFVRCLWISFLL